MHNGSIDLFTQNRVLCYSYFSIHSIFGSRHGIGDSTSEWIKEEEIGREREIERACECGSKRAPLGEIASLPSLPLSP